LENHNVSAASAQIKALSESALALANRGEVTDAEQVYKRILAVAPYHASSLSFMASQATSRGNPQEALMYLDKAVEGNPNNPLLLLSRAHVHVSLRAFEPALSDLDRALALDPDLHSALLYKALAHKGLGDLNAATRFAATAIKRLSDTYSWPNKELKAEELPEVFIEATNMIRAAQLALIDAELQPLIERHGKDSVNRIFEGIAVFAGLRVKNPGETTPQRQAVQITGLTERSVFVGLGAERATETRQNIDTVRNEAGDLLAQRALQSQARPRGGAAAGDTTPAKYSLNLTEEQRAAAPAFAALLQNLRFSGATDDAGMAALILAPAGQHILQRDTGENWLLTGYVVLEGPPSVTFTIGKEALSASIGECIVASNLADHTIQVEGAGSCLLLSFPLWHPELSETEVEGLAAVLRAFARFRAKYL